ncbi:MAG: hypothetical protein NTZ72_18485, partial [Afipia sp.]|nr:hypothetical protein [Afipia sp.]
SSTVAREKGFHQSTWSTFALTGGPHLSDVYFKDSKTARTPGERVRFIDIPLPTLAKGGIFDRAEDSDLRPHELAKQLEDGVAQNYGHLFPAWLKVLLNTDQSDALHAYSEHFLSKVLTPASTAYDRRFAKKFALVYAVGKLAVKAGLLPWPNDWPMRAISRCYYRAYATLHAPDEMTEKTIRTLTRLADDGAAFNVISIGKSKRVTLTPDMIGVRARYKDQDVLGLRDKALRRLCGSKSAAERVVAKLKLHGAIIGGHGHAGTTQLPITLYVDGSRYLKPRFWLIAPDRLKAILPRQ